MRSVLSRLLSNIIRNCRQVFRSSVIRRVVRQRLNSTTARHLSFDRQGLVRRFLRVRSCLRAIVRFLNGLLVVRLVNCKIQILAVMVDLYLRLRSSFNARRRLENGLLVFSVCSTQHGLRNSSSTTTRGVKTNEAVRIVVTRVNYTQCQDQRFVEEDVHLPIFCVIRDRSI